MPGRVDLTFSKREIIDRAVSDLLVENHAEANRLWEKEFGKAKSAALPHPFDESFESPSSPLIDALKAETERKVSASRHLSPTPRGTWNYEDSIESYLNRHVTSRLMLKLSQMGGFQENLDRFFAEETQAPGPQNKLTLSGRAEEEPQVTLHSDNYLVRIVKTSLPDLYVKYTLSLLERFSRRGINGVDYLTLTHQETNDRSNALHQIANQTRPLVQNSGNSKQIIKNIPLRKYADDHQQAADRILFGGDTINTSPEGFVTLALKLDQKYNAGKNRNKILELSKLFDATRKKFISLYLNQKKPNQTLIYLRDHVSIIDLESASALEVTPAEAVKDRYDRLVEENDFDPSQDTAQVWARKLKGGEGSDKWINFSKGNWFFAISQSSLRNGEVRVIIRDLNSAASTTFFEIRIDSSGRVIDWPDVKSPLGEFVEGKFFQLLEEIDSQAHHR